ncbi:uncharacterized protein LOC135399544 [Ornithodoros turicata]|uniref:uncharacterized protein LOC135399544 n=1 Tax=Ornithodoros turicata TaxID=34597 RepID=UPI0031386A2B
MIHLDTLCIIVVLLLASHQGCASNELNDFVLGKIVLARVQESGGFSTSKEEFKTDKFGDVIIYEGDIRGLDHARIEVVESAMTGTTHDIKLNLIVPSLTLRAEISTEYMGPHPEPPQAVYLSQDNATFYMELRVESQWILVNTSKYSPGSQGPHLVDYEPKFSWEDTFDFYASHLIVNRTRDIFTEFLESDAGYAIENMFSMKRMLDVAVYLVHRMQNELQNVTQMFDIQLDNFAAKSHALNNLKI